MKRNLKVAVLGDIHSPFHCRKSWRLLMSVLRDWKPDVTIQVGDLVDAYHFGEYPKTHLKLPSAKVEIDTTRRLLDDLDSLGGQRVLCTGNHDMRWWKYICKNSPALAEFVTLEGLLQLRERGWKVVPYQKLYKLGKFYFTHDLRHYGDMAAKQNLSKVNHNILTGHVHNATTIYRGTMLGERWVSGTVGWLGDPKQPVFDYADDAAKKHTWQNGFGIIHMDPQGHGHYQFIPFVKGKCVVDGKWYKTA